MTEKKNILIIDDDMISIHMGMMILKELEFEADHAENGQEALERLSQKQYDLILLDIMMPEMSGFDLAGHLKKNPATADIPIIFLTSLNDPVTIAEAFRLGGNEYISKPFNNLEFLVRVKNQITLSEYNKRLKEDKQTLQYLLDDATKQLIKKEKEAAYAEVIQGIVHNLRAPITIAKQRVELMEIRNEDILQNGGYQVMTNESLLGYISLMQKSYKIVDQAIERINKMVNSLLVKSANDHNEDIEIFDLNEMIDHELNFFSANQFFKHEVNKNFIRADYPLPLKASVAVISQVFGNILKNAIEELYTIESPEIIISSGLEKDYVWFSVKDNGHGIPNEIQDKIFNPFFTTKPREKGDDENAPIGTGLGLHFSYKAINDLDGFIRLNSNPGEGTEFKVYIPLCKDNSV
jgi:signal transduction histidine kinase